MHGWNLGLPHIRGSDQCLRDVPGVERREEPKESKSSTPRAPIESKGATTAESSPPGQEPVGEAVDGGSQSDQEPVGEAVDGGSQPGQEAVNAPVDGGSLSRVTIQ